jgi:murein DD-endopeptidase MepM/ murein hydrolase activator NlpD
MKLQLKYPVTPFHVNQGFGVNGAYYQANGINIKGHNGLDLQAYHGQPVYASHDGVAFYEEDNNAGHGMVVISNQPYDYKGGQSYFKTIYWHFIDPLKEPKYDLPLYKYGVNSGRGIPVKAGDQIGWADSTGLSTGDHLHFGLKPIMGGRAPSFGDAPDVNIGQWVNVEGDNGYQGAIDPTPYFEASSPTPMTEQEIQDNLRAQISTVQKIIGILKQLLGYTT